MTIKDELCPTVKVDARLLGDGTLWIKTDKIDDIGRVIVEDGKMSCKQFYQDAQPEPCEDAVSREKINKFCHEVIKRDPDGDNDIVKAFEAFRAYVNSLPPVTPKQDWIPVEKDTPKSSEDDLEYPTVLACFCDGTIDTACFYESTKEWGCGDEYEHICHPVAWMPLPEPYKGVTE